MTELAPVCRSAWFNYLYSGITDGRRPWMGPTPKIHTSYDIGLRNRGKVARAEQHPPSSRLIVRRHGGSGRRAASMQANTWVLLFAQDDNVGLSSLRMTDDDVRSRLIWLWLWGRGGNAGLHGLFWPDSAG